MSTTLTDAQRQELRDAFDTFDAGRSPVRVHTDLRFVRFRRIRKNFQWRTRESVSSAEYQSERGSIERRSGSHGQQ